MFNQEYKDKQAKDVYRKCKGSNLGIDMIEKNHIKTKDITANMKLFKEVKGSATISTYFDRIEIRNGNALQVLRPL